MTNEQIEKLALECGFTARELPDGRIGLRPYVVEFARQMIEQMRKDGWRQCAQGQKTTQFCGLLEEAVKAEREDCMELAIGTASRLESCPGSDANRTAISTLENLACVIKARGTK